MDKQTCWKIDTYTGTTLYGSLIIGQPIFEQLIRQTFGHPIFEQLDFVTRKPLVILNVNRKHQS